MPEHETEIFPRQLKAILLSLALLAFVVWAGLYTWASVQFKLADLVAAEFTAGEPLHAIQLSEANDRMDRILKIFPGHPGYLDLKGQLLEFSADLPGVRGQNRKRYLDQAAEQYRKSVYRRPLWPYSWAALVSVKDKLGNIDGEYIYAFERSIELGPWEPRIQLQLLRSGLSHWPELGPRQHELVGEVIGRAIQRQPNKMFSLIRAFARPDLVCDQYPDQSQVQRYCKRVGWVSN
jgi:hypothetical protein